MLKKNYEIFVSPEKNKLEFYEFFFFSKLINNFSFKKISTKKILTVRIVLKDPAISQDYSS